MSLSPTAQIARRRTFAIISHPDAGKTTLTEKFLLYGGAINLAGAVTSRKNQRTATSDWMELEKQRGISITSTVLQFEYNGYCVNLLDTPGHRDFSEDTYRVLTAVDSVIMVIDAAKGIEPQTRKLFEICRQRKIPILTFMNKLDRPSRPPIELLDELENVLGIHAYAVNWPMGNGPTFRGIYSRLDKQAHFFKKTPGGAYRAPVTVASLDDPHILEQIPEDELLAIAEELELIDGVGPAFDLDAVHRGELTPVFFGSAMNNFGVQLLLDNYLQVGLPPQPRVTASGPINPDRPAFSGFIFKIQANMDPNHRDRIAFVRVCSGQFSREMSVYNPRIGKRVRLSSAHKLFGRERETVDEAWPGDIVGIIGHDDFRIGDTLTEENGIVFHEMPTFTPEVFAYIHNDSTAQYKRFREGLTQLLQEGVVQVLTLDGSLSRVPLLGAVGGLQFEVVQYRLKSEYGADSRLERTAWTVMRWLPPTITQAQIDAATLPTASRLGQDQSGRRVILFESEWPMRYFLDKNKDIPLLNWAEVDKAAPVV